nr:Ldh family oxidoreductase [Burkholderia ambifaria]
MMTAHFTFETLVARLSRILVAAGCSERVADLIAKNCASADRDGANSHGSFRLPGYVLTLRAGWVEGQATPVVEDCAASFVRIDACNGFAVPALAAGAEMAIEKARSNGVVVVAIRNSHHLGALSFDVEPFAEQGFIALSMVNSMKCVVPDGCARPVLGTNPLAFAAPRASGSPYVFDLATSAMAHIDVKIARDEGRRVPDGVGVDRFGTPTGDPAAIIDGGALCTFGGHKGTALSMMIEIMCAALVGSSFSYECDLAETPGAATPKTGQTLILIDPEAGRVGLPPFGVRVDELLDTVIEAGQERLPGARRLAARTRAMREGIALSAEQLRMIEALEVEFSLAGI